MLYVTYLLVSASTRTCMYTYTIGAQNIICNITLIDMNKVAVAHVDKRSINKSLHLNHFIQCIVICVGFQN